MKMKRWLSLLLACVLAFGLLAGCGQDEPTPSKDPNPVASQPTQQNQGQNNVDGNTNADNTDTVQRSEINYAITGDPANFDPFTFSGTGADQAFVGLYQPLVHIINGELYSSILKKWSYSDDGLTFYGELYDYITDSKGNNIKASDVVFSYNMAEEYAGLGTGGWVSSFVATGDYTIEITFPQPLGVGRFDKLCKFNIVSEKAYKEFNMSETPVGTGPYVVTDYVSGYSVTLEKREDYWQTDATQICPRDMANVDKINLYVIGEAAQRTIALQNGSVDAAVAISADDLAHFENSDDHWVYAYAADICYTLIPNCDSTRATGDVNLRKAIFYAVNNEVIVKSACGGSATPSYDWCPSWAVGYNPDWLNETDNFYTFSQDKSKDYLSKSDYNNEELIILVQNNPVMSKIAELVSTMLDQVGIKSRVNVQDPAIAREQFGDVNAWDLYINMSATNTYWIDGVNGFLTDDKTTWYGSQNFWYEEDIQEMLKEAMQPENATLENFEVIRDYLLDNALGMSLANPQDYLVVPNFVSAVCVSNRKYMMPGGNTYVD